jgi:membrane dipeptidase
MKYWGIFSLVFSLAVGACRVHRVQKLLKTTPVVDTHIDFPENLYDSGKWYKEGFEAWALNNPEGNFDYTRAKKGGLTVPFMSIYIPAEFQKTPGRPRSYADSLITLVERIVARYPGQFALARTADEVERNFARGLISLPMGMENGAPIESLADVAYWHQRGIRYVTLTHSRVNRICDASYDTVRTHHGLSDYGRQVVREMNRVGIMVDVSHLSDESIMDVLEVAKKPLIATHSACRHFTPGFERNLPDTLIQAIARTGGVVQVPFSHYFLGTQARVDFKAVEKRMKDQGLNGYSPEGRQFLETELGKLGVNAGTVVDHIDHIVRLVGIDHVGLGSDYDGVGFALPPDLSDVSKVPNLLVELFKRGYSKADIRKICYQNTLRVWRANEAP